MPEEKKLYKNYLYDAMKLSYNAPLEYRFCSEDHTPCKEQVTVNGKCYLDPDRVSSGLYEDMKEFIQKSFDDIDIKRILKRSNSQLCLDWDGKYEHELTTDYIGPSRTDAQHYLNDEDKDKEITIGKYLQITRTFGGHLFWPGHQDARGKHTINQARGYYGNQLFDRIDITLAELQNYLDSNTKKARYSQPLYDAFERYDWFWKGFFDNSFDVYVEKMHLKMFLDDGRIISLADSVLADGRKQYVDDIYGEGHGDQSYLPQNYSQYICNLQELIRKRTVLIADQMQIGKRKR